MNPLAANRLHLTRLALFGKTATGIGAAALASLLNQSAIGNSQSAIPDLPHFAPRAKRVIYLFQNGAPSHVDLFDYKPKLKEWHGKEIPPEIQGGARISSMTSGQKSKPVLSDITNSKRHGNSAA